MSNESPQPISAPCVLHPNLHVLLYGQSGFGKSTAAATFPKKMLVLAFDRWDNIKPYIRQGVESYRADEYAGPVEARQATAKFYQTLGVPVTDVRDASGNLLIRIEHYYDDNPDHFTAYPKFNNRMKLFTQNPKEWKQWRTVVLDSLTFFQNAAVGWERTVNNPGKEKALKWYGDSKFHLEGLLYGRMGSADTNIVVCGHEASKDLEFGSGGSSRGIAAMGQLSAQVPAGFGEVYHLVVEKNVDGKLERILRTDIHEDADGKQWFAKTQEGVPDRCAPNYEALWRKEGS